MNLSKLVKILKNFKKTLRHDKIIIRYIYIYIYYLFFLENLKTQQYWWISIKFFRNDIEINQNS